MTPFFRNFVYKWSIWLIMNTLWSYLLYTVKALTILGCDVYHHFQQYSSYIMAVSFIGGGNRRKPATCRKSLTNFITKCWIKYTLPWAWFELSTLVVIGTDCLGSCKFNYYTITTMMAPDNFEDYTLIIEIYSNILVDYVFV